MAAKDPAAPGFKQKAKDELNDFLVIAAYLAFFFCALSTYSSLLLRKYDVKYLDYGFAIINALVIAKVILIGEMAHMGRRFEDRLLYLSVLYKAFVFSVLVFAFHIVEEFVKRLIHHKPAGTVLEEINYDELISRAIVIFCTFLPLFAFRELHRVLGHGRLYTLFFKPRDGGVGSPALDKK
jgi:hypothetical protein